jgi:DNA repair protein RecO (recombination protein O)
LRDGFALTGFFLARHVYDPRGEPLPGARYRFIAAAVGAE